jgi:hypothetical protein
MDAIAAAGSTAAVQQNAVTIEPQARRMLWSETPPWGGAAANRTPMTAPHLRRLVIRGVTHNGRTFRPSDWAERLAGAMSSFRPGGATAGIADHIGYSPYCVPRVVEGVKSVLVDEALRDIEPMAWDFVMNFARDNDLEVVAPVAPDC